LPTFGGRKYGVCTWTLYLPGGTGIVLRPHTAGTRWPLISMTGLTKKKKNANGMNLVVTAIDDGGYG
jgi:hypothetical protein